MDHGPDPMLITIAAALAAGVMLMALAHRLHISSIALLLVGGVALGPEGAGIVQTDALPEGVLSVIVSLAVGLILFEGGLTLDVAGFRSASGVIKRLLSIGVLTTWLTTAAAIYIVMDGFAGQDFDFALCLLAASLVIVTGPTVIQPLLKRIRVERKLHSILHWEGVLIDPVGVFIALLCFEWYTTGHGAAALGEFATRIGAGVAIGLAGGWLIAQILRLRLVPDEMTNAFTVGFAVALFGASEAVASETGLLSVTIAGFLLGVIGPEQLKQLREFKAEITELMIGLLFILLASRLELDNFTEYGEYLAWAVGAVVVLVRPLNVLLSSWDQGLNWREKAFLSWVAPRGIVAASMASLIALTLADPKHDEAASGRFIETFTYSIIGATVLLQAPTAGLVARVLQLRRPTPKGWLIIGASPLARRVARFLDFRAQTPALLIDINARNVAAARARGLEALLADARDAETLTDRDELIDVGNVLALTDNEALNVILCQRWAGLVGTKHVFRWASRARANGEKRGTVGRPIWPDLPKPSTVSMELERGDAVTFFGPTVETSSYDPVSPLVAVTGDRITTDPEQAKSDGADVGATLHLRRRAAYLQRALRSRLVIRSTATDAAGVLDDLLAAFAAFVPHVPQEAIRSDLTEREHLLASLLGKGVAVPHASGPALDARLCAVAHVPDGADFGAPDDVHVRLVFMLLSPAGDPEGHQATLAEVAALVADDEVLERLFSAATPEELLTRLRERGA